MTKSKTLATWLALLAGPLGLHRFYLHGLRDAWGWLMPLPTFLGVLGVQRVLAFGQDDRLAWALLPLGGLSLFASALTAIVYGLCSDERWNARHNRDAEPSAPAGWLTVGGVIVALLIGATALLSVISFSLQRYFELQLENDRAAAASASATARTASAPHQP